jgi:hypothetical protein
MQISPAKPDSVTRFLRERARNHPIKRKRIDPSDPRHKCTIWSINGEQGWACFREEAKPEMIYSDMCALRSGVILEITESGDRATFFNTEGPSNTHSTKVSV